MAKIQLFDATEKSLVSVSATIDEYEEDEVLFLHTWSQEGIVFSKNLRTSRQLKASRSLSSVRTLSHFLRPSRQLPLVHRRALIATKCMMMKSCMMKAGFHCALRQPHQSWRHRKKSHDHVMTIFLIDLNFQMPFCFSLYRS